MNIFAVWKPKGISSFGMVEKIRKMTGERRVGHAGTLDPLAEGILVIGVGREATKRLQNEEVKEKEYRVTIILGETSTTDDEEGRGQSQQPIAGTVPAGQEPLRKDIEGIVQEFIGEIEQIPPAFSAVHVAGKRAYVLARKGLEVKLEPRKVFIKEIEIILYEWPILALRVVTGKGVYIRSLARDIGERLGVGGYVHELVRTRVGEWTKENALTLDELPKVVGKP